MRERVKISELGEEPNAPRDGGLEWLEAEDGTPGAEASPGFCSLDHDGPRAMAPLAPLQGWQP